MILTGPEIRKQIELGRKNHDVEREVRVPSRHDVIEHRIIVDKKMNYIDVEPYDASLVGPNSIDLRIGNELLVYEAGVKRQRHLDYWHARHQKDPLTSTYFVHENQDDGWPHLPAAIPADSILDMRAEKNETYKLSIPDDGLILWPGVLYLGRTIETIGSNAFVPIVEGRSSVGRLGVHVHVTAGFCDLGFRGTITLEIHVLHPIKIYPNLPICQAYFLEPRGEIELYKGRYQDQVEPTASRFAMKVDDGRSE